ncbi:hypothetical protein MRB53_033093 [Persea americana]|uniref:Uncharacterized protein n=1 Tax=Persea americana TaxID=3435 RepID=A0ACC2KUA9_PERAE|nr:hypothetical protein MRB53_033093 [Persea americana]
MVARELIGKPIDWIGGALSQNKLTDSYRLLNIFIHHNVNPKGHKGVTKEDKYLLYYIGTQRTVDLPLALFRGVAKLQTASLNAVFPFPGLISKMLIDMGEEAKTNEDVIIPKQKIDLFIFEKAKSRLNIIELDDDEEKGDQAGPSEAGPSRAGPSDAGPPTEENLGEGEILVLHERLRHLEVRVDEGFTKMH